MIQYVGRFHSEDDPGGLIREVLDMGPEFRGPASDLLLAWVLRLEADVDPGAVAGRLIVDYGIAEGPVPEGACGELVELLREVALFGSERLFGATKPTRRGGWRRQKRENRD